MKRTMNWALLLLVIVMSLALVACGGTNTDNPTDPEENTTAPLVSDHNHCVCGGDAVGVGDHTACKDVPWFPWEGVANVKDGRNYYLTEDINGDFMYWEEGNKNISLCLNGHSITENDRMTIRGNINICDCAETNGTVTSMYNNTEDGEGAIGIIFADSTLTIYSGDYKLDASCAVYAAGGWLIEEGGNMVVYNGNLYGSMVSQNGGNIYLRNNSTFTMYGGSLIQSGELKQAARGANIFSDGGEVYILGDALITGGIAEHGGNVYMQTEADLQMTAGTITGGTCSNASGNGGNIYTKGLVDLSGGEISNGVASRGANVFLHTTGYMEMSGGKVTGGVATGNRSLGANVYVYEAETSYLEMTGGEISDGTADNGGNIYLGGCGSKAYFMGGEVKNGSIMMDDELGGGEVTIDGASVSADIQMGKGTWVIKKNLAPMTIKVMNNITTLRLNLADIASDCADITLEPETAGADVVLFYTDAATVPACLKAPAGYTLATEATSATTYKLMLKK